MYEADNDVERQEAKGRVSASGDVEVCYGFQVDHYGDLSNGLRVKPNALADQYLPRWFGTLDEVCEKFEIFLGTGRLV